MGTNINFKVNNISNENLKPLNWQETGIELNFDRDMDGSQQQVTLTEFEFVREGADAINQYVKDGLTNGNGVFEGLPLEIEVERLGVTEKPFKGYIDLTQSSNFSDNRCSVKCVESNRIDWLNDMADGFTFEHLMSIGMLSKNDYIYMPYVLNTVPNYLTTGVSILGVHVITQQIKKDIDHLVELFAELSALIDVSAVTKIILSITSLAVEIVALVKLIKDLFNSLIQPVKYHACMRLKKQLDVAATYLGMSFHCPILESNPYNDTVIIPQKYYNPLNSKDKSLFGFTARNITQEGFYKGTFGDLLRECKKLFNGKIQIRNSTEIWLIRDDETINSPQYTLPDLYNPYFSLNTNEFRSNTVISFQTDATDKNTIQNYKGVSYQVVTQPIRMSEVKNRLMKGLDDTRINFALAHRKEALTFPEELIYGLLNTFDTIVGTLAKIINKVIGVLNKVITKLNNFIKKLNAIGIKINLTIPPIPTITIPKISGLIENRIGMLNLEYDLFTIPKICVFQEGKKDRFNKLHPQNYNYYSARELYQKFHFVKSFIPSATKPNGNQFYIYNYSKVPFSFDDYQKVKENNRIFTADGKEAIIVNLKWNIFNQHAEIKVMVNKLYTNNLIENYYEPNGQ